MRFLTMASLFVLSIFAAQLVRIQGFDAHAVAEEARSSARRPRSSRAMRGQILDTDGPVLADRVVREVVVAASRRVHLRHRPAGRATARSAEAVPRAPRALAPCST